MKILTTPEQATAWARAEREAGRTVGLVPTMGALHEGHMALVRHAHERSDSVAVSIFVNPTQFAPREDFQRYPRTLQEDCAMLEAVGAAAVFAPDAADVYPEGYRTAIEVEGLSEVLEGALRPGHFRGVATVVGKLFHILPADVAVFGQKDYQQLVVLRRMAADLNFPVEILAHPTVREADGLAMSSRNRYLDPQERAAAPALSRALAAARAAAEAGRTEQAAMEAAAWAVLDAEPLVAPDYAVVLEAETLEPLPPDWRTAVCLVAGRLGATRLIDNVVFNRAGEEIAP